jgi:hypothetical protein
MLSHFFSLLKERIMARKFFSLFVGVCLVLGTLGFVGCDDGEDGEIPRFGPKVAGATLSGEWVSNTDEVFTIDTAEMTLSYESKSEYEGETYNMGFSGKIVGDVAADPTLLESKWGYITFQVTEAGDSATAQKEKYFMVCWKDLTSTTVQESVAYKATGNNSGTDALEAAVAEYTVENDYFAYFSPYTKKEE